MNNRMSEDESEYLKVDRQARIDICKKIAPILVDVKEQYNISDDKVFAMLFMALGDMMGMAQFPKKYMISYIDTILYHYDYAIKSQKKHGKLGEGFEKGDSQ